MRHAIAVSVRTNEGIGRPVADRARPIGARYPDSVEVQTWMAEIEYDAANYDAAMVAAERALALDPQNVLAMVYKGRVLMRRAIAAGDRALVREARDLFLKANRIKPDYALPFQAYYDSFALMGETPTQGAVDGLYSATVLVPQDPKLRIRAAIALLREGDVQHARSILAPAAFTAEEIGENKPLQLIKEMERTTDATALLAKAAELKLDKVNEFIAQDEEDGDDTLKALAASR